MKQGNAMLASASACSHAQAGWPACLKSDAQATLVGGACWLTVYPTMSPYAYVSVNVSCILGVKVVSFFFISSRKRLLAALGQSPSAGA